MTRKEMYFTIPNTEKDKFNFMRFPPIKINFQCSASLCEDHKVCSNIKGQT